VTPLSLRLLVSVRSVDEALLAADGGADFIDLKEPSAGALGGLPLATICAIVAAVRAQGRGLPVSATIGDLGMQDATAVLARVAEVGACGVDYVKVGIPREPGATDVLAALARVPHAVVPVFIADRGLDAALIELACVLRFPGVMADTADKLAGSLFDAVPLADLAQFVERVRRAGALVGLAGALRLPQLPALRALAPDFAGFRSAVCGADRRDALDPRRLRELVTAIRSTAGRVEA
jgi:(5-formylfuran-3-yl)methyl phosphate synthase